MPIAAFKPAGVYRSAGPAVASVEQVTGTLGPTVGTNTTTITLTKGQVASQCAPWISVRRDDNAATDNDCHQAMLDVNIFDDSGTAKVTVSRFDGSYGKVVFVLSVVCFNTSIRVQKIAISPPANTSVDWTRTVTTVNQARTFVLAHFYSPISGAGSDLPEKDRAVKVTWSSNTLLRFQRQGTPLSFGKIDGYAYVVEDLTGLNFSVTTYSHSAIGTTATQTITAVTVAKTMLVMTYSTNYDSGGSQSYHINCSAGITATTTITRRAGSVTNTQDISYQVVEWLSPAVSVQHGLLAQLTVVGVALRTFSVAIPTPVSDTKSIVCFTQSALTHGDTIPSANTSDQGKFDKMTASLDAGGANWTGAYYGATAFADTCRAYWQVIQFDVP